MAAISQDDILKALSTVKDPAQNHDIVSAGWVSGIAVREGHVAFALEIDPKRAAQLEPIRRAAEQAVMALTGVRSVSATLTAEKPAANTAEPASAAASRQKITLPEVSHIVAIASGKGGVGKSTLTVNLALALSALGLKIGIMDADIYGPSQPRMLGISGKPVSEDGKTLEPMRNFGLKCMSIGFMVPEESPMIWRGPMVMSAVQQLLRDVNWGQLDILLVDMPPGTGDAQLTLCQQVALSGAVIISTPQDIALLDARKGLNMFRKVGVPVLGLVENMSYFDCPHCGKRSDIFSHGGARAEADRLSVDFLGEIPLDIEIRQNSDLGQPIVAIAPESHQAEHFKKIAQKVWQKLKDQPQSAG